MLKRIYITSQTIELGKKPSYPFHLWRDPITKNPPKRIIKWGCFVHWLQNQSKWLKINLSNFLFIYNKCIALEEWALILFKLFHKIRWINEIPLPSINFKWSWFIDLRRILNYVVKIIYSNYYLIFLNNCFSRVQLFLNNR